MKRFYTNNKDNNRGYYLQETIGDGADIKSTTSILSEREAKEIKLSNLCSTVAFNLEHNYLRTWVKNFDAKNPIHNLCKNDNKAYMQIMYEDVLKIVEIYKELNN